MAVLRLPKETQFYAWEEFKQFISVIMILSKKHYSKHYSFVDFAEAN